MGDSRQPLLDLNKAEHAERQALSRRMLVAPETATAFKPLRGVRKVILLASGFFFVGMGVLGAILPVLPTTIFLILAAACFARSSQRMHRWIFRNRFFGEYLRSYMAGEGMSLGSKIGTLSFLWISLAASGIFAIPDRLFWVRFILAAVGAGVTIHIICIKTKPRKAKEIPLFTSTPEKSIPEKPL